MQNGRPQLSTSHALPLCLGLSQFTPTAAQSFDGIALSARFIIPPRNLALLVGDEERAGHAIGIMQQAFVVDPAGDIADLQRERVRTRLLRIDETRIVDAFTC